MDGDDREFCRRLVTEHAVAAIPASAFFADPAAGRGLIRFAFCKRVGTPEEAGARLAGSVVQ